MGEALDRSATGDAVEAGRGRGLERLVVIDLFGASAGAVLVLAANAVVFRTGLLWLVLAALLALIAALAVARREVARGGLFRPLLLIIGGNWLVALTVAYALPALWPVMVLTVLMPLVLATPYLGRTMMLRVLAAGAIMAGLVTAAGLLNDDGGALPDLHDGIEFVLVIGALTAMFLPIALIVWHNNQLQQANLDRATNLNRELLAIRDQLAASRRRVVEATDVERRRIERDLHDGAQQRLVALAVRLRLLEHQTDADAPVRPALAGAVAEVEETVEELRELAHGIYPPLLQSRGLSDALNAVARRSPLAVTANIEPVGRLDQSAETALYFTAMEALTNAAKHAPGSVVTLLLVRNESLVRLEVSDDGPGFEPDPEIHARGIANMSDRLAAVNGELAISSAPGGGTSVSASVPVGG